MSSEHLLAKRFVVVIQCVLQKPMEAYAHRCFHGIPSKIVSRAPLFRHAAAVTNTPGLYLLEGQQYHQQQPWRH